MHSFNKRKILLSIVILLAIPLTIFLIAQRQDIKKQAKIEVVVKEESLDDLQNELLRGSSDIKASPNKKKVTSQGNVIETAKKRKIRMKKLAEENPKEFLTYAIPSDVKDKLPDEAKSYVEEKVTEKGTFSIHHGDNFLKKTSDDTYFIGTTKAYFYERPKALPLQQITVEGYKLDSELVVAKMDGKNLFEIVPGGGDGFPSFNVRGEQKILVILLNFQDNQNKPLTKEVVYDKVFGSSDSVNSYYKEVSYNQIFLSGEVTDWITIPYNDVNGNYSYYNWAEAANEIMQNRGVYLEAFDKIVYVFKSNSFGYGGLGMLDDKYAWVNWYYADTWINYSVGVFIHELGHTFGVHHANALYCPVRVLDLYHNCLNLEYGDPTDVMGYGMSDKSFHFNAPHKDELGWLNNTQVQTITDPGVYRVYPHEVGTSDIKTLRIRKPESDGTKHYYIEYRQAVGLDGKIPIDFTKGVSIRVRNSFSSFQTLLLDVAHQTPQNFYDSALLDNNTFYDPYNGIRIKQLSHTPAYAEVQVDFDGGECIRNAPEVESYSSTFSGGYPGETVDFEVYIRNNDSKACTARSFEFSISSIPSGWQKSLDTLSVTIAPDAYQILPFRVTSSSNAQVGSYPIRLTLKTTDPTYNYSDKVLYLVYGNLGSVTIHPGILEDLVVGKEYHLSTLAYSTDDRPLFDGVYYSWGISSNNSIAALTKTYDSVTSIKALNPGSGDLYVFAYYNSQVASKSIPLSVRVPLPTSTPTPSQAPQSLSKVDINPGMIPTLKVGETINLSTIAYGDRGWPIWSGVTYEWGISSNNSIGTISPTNGVISTFKALSPGSGDLFVTARYNNQSITKSLALSVIAVSVTPNQLKGNIVPPNNIVDIFDYNAVVSDFGLEGQNLRSDVVKNDRVDIFDYNLVVSNFGNSL